MVRRAGWWIGSGVLLATLGCSGDEFASQGTGGSGGAVSGGGTGGAAGAGASGGMAGTAGGTGGAAGGPGPGGTGGTGGAAGTGGTGGSWPECGPLAGAPLLLYSTLDSLVAIKTPSKGVPPGSSLPTEDFQSAKCDHGIVIDQANEHVVFVQNQNINFAKGTIDFWYLPFAPETDDKLHHLFATSGYLKLGEGGLKIRKSDNLNANEFTVYIKDPAGATHKTSVPESAYSFVAKTPVRITVAWDLTAAVSSPAVRIFFDTVEAPSYGERALLPIITPIADANTGVMYVGAENSVDPTPAMGVIDDFKIYGAALAPQ